MSEVFLLCEYATLNGGERSMLATFGGARAAGFLPVVIAPPSGPLADALAARDIELLPFAFCDGQGVRIPQHQLREKLAEVLRRRRPTLLHANSLAMARLSGPVAAELALPSLGHLRDIIRLSSQAIADLNRHSRLLAVSQATRDFHIAVGLQAEKTYVVYNGVDLEEFRPRRPTGYLHREFGLPPDAQLIGSIGQIGLRKGQDVLLRAAADVAQQRPNVHYLLVGARHSGKEESRQFEHDLHAVLPSRVHFLGVRNDVAQLYGELTLLVHAARQEPLGRVLLEAAASGAAIIATRVGGTAEIFPDDGQAARLIPPDDPKSLGDAILELTADQALRHRLGEAARRRAEQQFDIRTAAGNLVRHYRELYSSRSA